MKSTLYIAYGSNLDVGQMARRCPTATVLDTGILRNYRLLFCGHPHSAFATVEPCQGSEVPVVVWRLRPRDEQALDYYEGVPTHYTKEHADVELASNDVVRALIYIMVPRPLGAPSPAYLATILRGYRDFGFDPDLLYRA
jgi:hypothetical protein